ncbi:outer membrane beta-barrel protein [Flavobacterium pectinovorum]|uniref:outer membrane beta-barrel protein n=1 Tax=Flavobacterium pectinovorum TaxID=29533 RepID=UPI001FAC7592|nr:outer membrane beta-barrel protein [Flavobacterium pectinovorum]MCI9843397.1 TonB-dependent receptor [Flavobacterium pectinovorum]
MTRLYYVLLLFIFAYSASAQNDIVLKGTVVDINTQLPVELATVYFTTVKDSTVIDYATTDKNGFFRLNTKKLDKPVFLKINYLGYQTYTEEQNGLLESKDFGKLYLLESVNALNEVVVKSEAPPIRMKQDTLEYNAASYKVRPDSNVETLLKQLPGFDIDEAGKITVNGREVNQLLVNGKPFFDRDGAIALKNLPSEIIQKVQVSDFKTKKEELSKQESTSDYSSINLTIDEKKNKGYFGKILAGYGSDDRYESSLIMNFFNNKQKISILGSSNNINSTGFAQDEVFDNMGGGRNSQGGGGNTGKGITQSNLLGINYSDDWNKYLSATGSYNFDNKINNNESTVRETSILPTGNNYTKSDSKTRNESTINKANFELEYKINPTTRLVITPNASQTRSNAGSDSFSETRKEDVNGAILNTSESHPYRESTSTNFSNTINFNKAFEKKARNVSLVFTNNNSGTDSDGIVNSTTVLNKVEGEFIDKREQKTKGRNISDSYSLDLEYTEPITDSLRIRFGTDFDWQNTANDLKTFDNKLGSEFYGSLVDSVSNYMSSKRNTVSPKVGLTLKKNKFTFNLNTRTAIIDFDNHSLYEGKSTDLEKRYALAFGNLQLRYKFSRSKFFTFKYDYSNALPSATQLMPVTDLNNSLNTVTGNPDLNPIEKNSVNFDFKNFDFRTRSGYSLSLRGDYFSNDVVSTSVFDEDTGKRFTTYINISGTYSATANGNWSQSIKKDAHTLRYGLGLNGRYSFDKGFTNTIMYNAKSTSISPKAYFTYEYGEILTISPSYGLTFSQTKYENTSRDANSTVIHRANLQTTTYWPTNLIFGNDFGYTYNSNISDDFKKDFYLWNTSLSYGFLDKKLYAKIKVYDVLNQNQSATRSISATSIRDEESTVLKRYVMFSVAYKIGNFATEKGSKRRGGERGDGGERGERGGRERED